MTETPVTAELAYDLVDSPNDRAPGPRQMITTLETWCELDPSDAAWSAIMGDVLRLPWSILWAVQAALRARRWLRARDPISALKQHSRNRAARRVPQRAITEQPVIIHLQTPLGKIQESMEFLRLRHFDHAELRLLDLIAFSTSVANPGPQPYKSKAPVASIPAAEAAVWAGARLCFQSALGHTRNQRAGAAIADLKLSLSRLNSCAPNEQTADPDRIRDVE